MSSFQIYGMVLFMTSIFLHHISTAVADMIMGKSCVCMALWSSQPGTMLKICLFLQTWNKRRRQQLPLQLHQVLL